MKPVTLREFQNLTGISDTALLELLRNNSMELHYDTEHGIRLDVGSVTIRALMQAVSTRQQQLLQDEREVLRERVASIITEELADVMDRALAIVNSKT